MQCDCTSVGAGLSGSRTCRRGTRRSQPGGSGTRRRTRARNEAAREVKHFMLRAHASPPVRGATDRVLARREHELRTQNLTRGNGATHYKKRRDGIHWRVRCFMNS
ncbi:hypothetical protein DIPPA_26999 [Diplonema papillatum]|nr:hypothetical protein DIPPA_26999 [Diplonema papillatum]